MIKNIIFDFGDIFINLDKEAIDKNLKNIGIESLPENMLLNCKTFETGDISTENFINSFVEQYHSKISGQNKNEKSVEFVRIWNSILLDFPIQRLVFLKELAKSKKYRLFLLSNTNDLHISWIKNDWGSSLYNEFKNCFEKFYLSHEINLRKPNANIYQFVLNNNNLKAEETLFIDDTKENTEIAKSLNIHVWNLKPKEEDITELFTKNHLS